MKGEHVVDALTRIIATRGIPKTIKVGNGSEFISKAMDRWAYGPRNTASNWISAGSDLQN